MLLLDETRIDRRSERMGMRDKRVKHDTRLMLQPRLIADQRVKHCHALSLPGE